MPSDTEPAGGACPPDDVLRLLRLLARRAAVVADVDRGLAAGDGGMLRVEAVSGLVGLVAPETWRAGRAAGLVHVAPDGSGRLSPAGLALVRRLRSSAGAPVAVEGAGSQPHGDAAVPAQPHVAERPGFDADESPLAWLARRRDKSGRPLIEAREYDAGERFRADFWFAQMSPRVTANWSGEAPGGRGRKSGGPVAVDVRDNVVAAQERVRRALAAVGPELSGVIVDVCGHLKGLEQAERGAGWPARSGRIVLQLALQALARHYGMTGTPRGAGAVRHWGGDGYKPQIDG